MHALKHALTSTGLALLIALLGACAQRPVAEPPAAAALPSSRAKALDLGRIIVAGQPNEADLDAYRDEGVGLVFNVRTAAEMDDRSRVPFDQTQLTRSLGLDYRTHPIDGREYPFTPEILDAFAAAVAAQPGKVLLHCASGNRAGWLYAAYAVKYLGQSPDAAMRALEPLGHWPLPIELLTGIPLELQRAN